MYLVLSDSCPVAQSDSCIVVWYNGHIVFSQNTQMTVLWFTLGVQSAGCTLVQWYGCDVAIRQMYGGSVRQFIVITISCIVLLSDN